MIQFKILGIIEKRCFPFGVREGALQDEGAPGNPVFEAVTDRSGNTVQYYLTLWLDIYVYDPGFITVQMVHCWT